jgi:ATP-dependent RNA helicase HrpB
MTQELPVAAALPALRAALQTSSVVILVAPPGAGKSTHVPLELLEEPWLRGGRTLMLQPRRLAARAVAARMASLLGEPLGRGIGYHVRFERRASQETRVEVLTEGILTRRTQDDPGLEGVGLVIFDEFHERSLHADLALALTRRIQTALRPELRILLMSATLDATALSAALGDAPVVSATGRAFPVEVRHARHDEVRPDADPTPALAAAVRRVLATEAGDVLVFLPGAGEIRRLAAALESLPDVALRPLYGDLPLEEQQAAILPGPRRRVVLATNVAETSLTIEGVRVVLDAGLVRVARFDPFLGLPRLETLRVSRASADQRAGRAGRLGPGVCVRLWSEATHAGLLRARPPEILESDLAPLQLELAAWGEPASALSWVTEPPAAALALAAELLERLGATRGGALTPHGRAVHALGIHPRLGHLLVEGARLGLGSLACDVAALLEERDPLPREAGADLTLRVEALRAWRRRSGGDGSSARLHQVDRLARAHRERLRLPSGEDSPVDARELGRLLALAFPERVAQRREGSRERYRLANGRGARLRAEDPLAGEPWLAVGQLDAGTDEGRVYLAAPVDPAELATERREVVAWDARSGVLVAREETRVGELVLEARPKGELPEETRVRVLCDAIRAEGLSALAFSEDARRLQARVSSLRAWGREADFPDTSDAALLAGLESWLGPLLGGVARRDELARLDLESALLARLDPVMARRLEAWAPSNLRVPSGSRLRLEYPGDGRPPELAVRLQEVFGWLETPAVNDGRTRVTLRLLSPAFRPVQVTQDLRSFWTSTYPEVRKELRARYPKHAWPEDPLTAAPVRGARRRRP